MGSIEVRPVGLVRVVNQNGSISDLIMNKELVDALEGIEEYSHVYVLYWMHNLEAGSHGLKLHPWGNEALPLLGIFATRTQYRPNPVGLTLVKLLAKTGNVLRVKGLDALDETPIIDIKPFDLWDVEEYANVKVPGWWRSARPERWKAWQKLLGK